VIELIVLYKAPKDPEHFEKYYREVHGPMTGKLPGPAITTALRLPSMPWPRRKVRRAMPTCRTTITRIRSSCSSKSKPTSKPSQPSLQSTLK
jgi:hypothetical protein